MDPSDHRTAGLLQAPRGRGLGAFEKLIRIVYKVLPRRAHDPMGYDRPGHTLQTTSRLNANYPPTGQFPETELANNAYTSLQEARKRCAASYCEMTRELAFGT